MSDLEKIIEHMEQANSLEENQYYKIELLNAIQQLTDENRELRGLLSVAQCPNCDGSGAIVVEGVGCEAGCCGNFLPSGECCGNPVPIPVPTQELQQCEWCCRKDAVLAKQGDSDE